MTAGRDRDSRAARATGWLRRMTLRVLQRLAGFPTVLLAIVWLVLPALPEGSGLRFGVGYQLFFSGIIVGAGLFFWLVGMKPLSPPRGGRAVAGRVALVYAVTVGLLVLVGNSYLQFATPSAGDEAQTAAGPAQEGERLFWANPPGCFLCHSIGARGGQRAPNLEGVATRAGTRIPGTAAPAYIEGHIREGLNFRYTVPGFAPIMPPFGSILSDEQIAALVAYLMTLE